MQMLSVTVVIATRNRWPALERTLGELGDLPEAPPVVVIDNASTDGTPGRVRRWFPGVDLVALPGNFGASARTVGARLATTPFVAFADDDSWWAEGSLPRAAEVLSADPAIALLAARVVVGEAARLDPTSALMAAGPLDESYLRRPGGRRGVTGFLACGAVCRRRPFLAVGGFNPLLLIGGEEELTALDLADSGWKLVYDPEVEARHHPSPRDEGLRRRLLARNALLTAWLRYSTSQALHRTGSALRAVGRYEQWLGLAEAAALAPWVIAHRRPVRFSVEEAFLAAGVGRRHPVPA